MARIFLIDDHPAVRHGLNVLLSEEHEVCGEASCVVETLNRIETSSAEIAILDLSLGDESGLELINELHGRGMAVLVYSMHEDAKTIESAFAAGADGYVTKREVSSALLTAVSDLLAGIRHISPRAAQTLANSSLSPKNVEPKLSERERQIIAMLGQGESNGDIAVALTISIRTVETYYTRIIEKLDLSGMKTLRRYAIQRLRVSDK